MKEEQLYKQNLNTTTLLYPILDDLLQRYIALDMEEEWLLENSNLILSLFDFIIKEKENYFNLFIKLNDVKTIKNYGELIKEFLEKQNNKDL